MNINDIDDKNFLVRVTVALEFLWEDSRIRVRVNDSSSMETPITVDYEFVQNIWIPDFFVYDLQDFRIMKLIGQQPQGGLRKEGVK